jgi:SAM-dependent methyltransferase
MEIAPGTLDAVYSRWSLCWVRDVESLVQRLASALKPGGVLAIQEYFDWGTHSAWPPCPTHARLVQACLTSFAQSEGEINIGRTLPVICARSGLKVTHLAPLSRIGKAGSMEWQWVTTFLHSYAPRLIQMGLLEEAEYLSWQADWAAWQQDPAAFVYCPQMIELVCEKGAQGN